MNLVDLVPIFLVVGAIVLAAGHIVVEFIRARKV